MGGRTVDRDGARSDRRQSAAAYFGLMTKRKQSGAWDPEMHLTGAGDMRRLLVQCAQQMLSAKGKESDLRTWGLNLASRGAKTAKKKAVIATARKLGVLLHVLCRNLLGVAGQVYLNVACAKKAWWRSKDDQTM
ncbi:MAG: transposase [bacterium]|nr:transposase [bacterium]